MPRKSNGWVKIYYGILKEKLTPSQFKFFVGSIVLANPPNSNGAGMVDLSLRKLANLLKMSKTEVSRREQELSQRGMITFRPGGKGFIINKYSYYQSKGVPPTGQLDHSRLLEGVPPTGQLDHSRLLEGVPPTGQNVPPTGQNVPPTGQNVPPTGHDPTHEIASENGPYKKEEDKEVKKIKKNTPIKKNYGEGKNVKLTDLEYANLVERFGEEGTTVRIDNLSTYIASKGRKYKSHYFTLLNWENMNKKGQQKGVTYGTSGGDVKKIGSLKASITEPFN